VLALQIAVWNYAQGVLLHVVQIHDLGLQVHLHEITGVAPWTTSGRAHSAVPPDELPSPSVLRVAVAVDSARPQRARALWPGSRGGTEPLTQAAAVHGVSSQQRATQPSAEGCATTPSAYAPPACLIVQVDCDTGGANAIRHLVLFDAPCRGDTKDAGPVMGGCSPTPVRSMSVACDARHVAAGFQSGSVAIWSGGSARLLALLRDPHGSSVAARRDRGSQASSSGRLSQPQHAGAGKRRNPAVTCIAMHPSLPLVVVGRADGVLDVWAPQVGLPHSIQQ